MCEALWGRLGPADPEDDVETPSEYEQQLERRRTFSAWLSRGATSRVEEEVALAGKGSHTEAIFSYLTGNCISEACRLAQKEGEIYNETRQRSCFIHFFFNINSAQGNVKARQWIVQIQD